MLSMEISKQENKDAKKGCTRGQEKGSHTQIHSARKAFDVTCLSLYFYDEVTETQRGPWTPLFWGVYVYRAGGGLVRAVSTSQPVSHHDTCGEVHICSAP